LPLSPRAPPNCPPARARPTGGLRPRARKPPYRALLDRFGAGERPIWITETSYTSETHDQYLPAYRAGESTQARSIHDALAAQLSSEAEVIFWALLTDAQPTSAADPYRQAGLHTFDLHPKPAATAFRALAQRLRAAREP